jgi:hypothetical protein
MMRYFGLLAVLLAACSSGEPTTDGSVDGTLVDDTAGMTDTRAETAIDAPMGLDSGLDVATELEAGPDVAADARETAVDATRDTAAPRCGDGVVNRGEFCLGTAVVIPTSAQTYEAVVADFNGDHYLDVATSALTGTLHMALSTGPRALAPPTMQAVPGGVHLDSADLDRDGNADIVLSLGRTGSSGHYGIILGRGDGTFMPATSISLTANPGSVALADLDGDGNIDIAADDLSPSQLHVALGRGDGTFMASSVVAMPTSPAGLAAVDMNGDGHRDLVVAAAGSINLHVVLNTGTGTFRPSMTTPVGLWPLMVCVADLNGDARPDVVIPDRRAMGLSVLLGNGDGTFRPMTTVALGSTPAWTDAGDLDNDGAIDLIVVHASAEPLLLRGNGDGTFRTPETLSTRSTSTAMSVYVRDLDRDGALDFVEVSEVGRQMRVFFSNP